MTLNLTAAACSVRKSSQHEAELSTVVVTPGDAQAEQLSSIKGRCGPSRHRGAGWKWCLRQPRPPQQALADDCKPAELVALGAWSARQRRRDATHRAEHDNTVSRLRIVDAKKSSPLFSHETASTRKEQEN
jgi:hypothetical protein